MPLESCVVCLDTSAWMINGDYYPSRLAAQQDAANLLCMTKLEANVESTVGVLAHGKNVRVLTPPTDDESAILASLDGLKAGGAANMMQGIKIAMLALKHRRNKNGDKRVIIFVGSPVTNGIGALKKLGNQMRRNNVALDVVGLGEHEENGPKLKALVDAANDDTNNSSYVPIPEGIPPADALMSSPIVTGFGGAAGGAGAGQFAQYGGVNPELDPALAMTIAESLETMRRETEAKDEASKTDGAADASATGDGAASAPADAGSDNPSTPAAAAPASTPAAPAPTGGAADFDEDEELQRALMMSLMDDGGAAEPAPAPAPAPAAEPAATPAATAAPATAPAAAASGDASAAPAAAPSGEVYDEEFVNSLLSELPGVDPSDPTIQAMLRQLGGDGSGDASGDASGDSKKDDADASKK